VWVPEASSSEDDSGEEEEIPGLQTQPSPIPLSVDRMASANTNIPNNGNKRKRSEEDDDYSDDEFRAGGGGAKTVKRRVTNRGCLRR
jgi:hypothetical protein